MNKKIRQLMVGPTCFVEAGKEHLTIGDDLHMNGLDAPAHVIGHRDLVRLRAIITAVLGEGPWPTEDEK